MIPPEDRRTDSPETRAEPTRPPILGFRRVLRTYHVGLLVLASYLLTRFLARFAKPTRAVGMWQKAHERNARRIHRAILDLQGLFIKVGQLISILANVLPEGFRSRLESLQDRVPPHPYEDVERRILEEFGQKPDAIFTEFDRTPLAAASIGQVHKARLEDGTLVAVKIQYPEIDHVARGDLKFLRRLVGWMERIFPEHGFPAVYNEIRAMVLAELDFRQEADNLTRIAKNLTEEPNVAFPVVIERLTTKTVLTTTFQDGFKVSDHQALDEAGIDRTKLAKQIIHAYCEQIFVHGLYHADPHPGNLIVRPNDDGSQTVVFLDFGAVATISQNMKEGIVSLIMGALAHDSTKVASALKTMGFMARSADPETYHRIIDFFHRKLHQEIRVESFSFKDITFNRERGLEDLADLRSMDITLQDLARQFHVPKEWILLERTLLLLTGLCTELDPNLNPSSVVLPYVKQSVLGEKDTTTFMLEAAKEVVLSLAALPGELRQAIAMLEQGKISMRFSNLERNVQDIQTLGRQFLFGFLGLSAAAFSLAFEDRGMHEQFVWSLWLSGGFFGIMLVSILGSWRRR
ncbi:MAG: AarF/ABC1/UbiB kinase family protein [Deltaproteobacteria bacterium]|nr:AarF/ABC1/UbiB kinase family protein [Deltaproteobacteria bacterium]